jgi:hypothetical protein
LIDCRSRQEEKMKFWAAEEAINYLNIPSEVADIVNVTLTVLDMTGDERIRLVRIGQNDGELEDERFQIDLELAPGIILPTMLGSVEGVANGWDDPIGDEDNLCRLLEEGLAACLPRREELANTLHDARLRARQVLAKWNAAGIPTRLLDVQIAQYDYWRGSREPGLSITIEDLDDVLRPTGLKIAVEHPGELEAELEIWREGVEAAFRRRTLLASRGASGTIDQIALNILAHFGDVGEGVRRLSTETRLWFDDDNGIFANNGDVSSGGGGLETGLQVTGDYITVPSTYVPAEQLKMAVGHPVSRLVDYAFLSDEITVVEAYCAIADNQPMLTIKIDNPKRLFCSASGRVWDDLETTAVASREDENAGGNVVPFRARSA